MTEADTAVSACFAKYQKNHIVTDGVIPKWFHGNISRKQAEEMLMTKPSGCFLIRVSESRIGFSLSYKAKDTCRHFMINTLPGNQCEIVGDKLRHCSLHDLVAFHSRSPVPPYTELLTEACDQAGENILEDSSVLPVLCSVSQTRNQNLSNLSAVSISSSRLYPSLEKELDAFDLDSVESQPTVRQKFTLAPQDITTRWHCAQTKTTTGVEHPTSLPTGRIQEMSQEKVVQKCQAESKHTRVRLIQYNNIFKKNKKHSVEQVCGENDEAQVTTESAANPDLEEVDAPFGRLPAEYLNPPPFAPGY